MNAYRTKPKFGETDSLASRLKSDNDSMGCVFIPIAIVIGYIVVSAIVRTTSNTGSKFDQIICYGTLIVVTVICILGIRDMVQESLAKDAEKEKWKKVCNIAQENIVERLPGGTYDDGYRYHSVSASLKLEMNSDQRAVSPTETIVRVDVPNYIYKKLAERDTVRIYYKPEAPLTFLLEEEL